jgi:hypothetical protein
MATEQIPKRKGVARDRMGRMDAEWHRVGLERPHFCTRFRAQSDVWVAPAHMEISSGVFSRAWPDCRRQLGRDVNKVNTARTTHCTLRVANFFTRCSTYGIRSKEFAATTSAKVTARKRSGRAGATPLFRLRSAQKFCEVAPALVATSRRSFARLYVGTQELVRQSV